MSSSANKSLEEELARIDLEALEEELSKIDPAAMRYLLEQPAPAVRKIFQNVLDEQLPQEAQTG